jgi:hypothetical protein
MNIKSFVKKMIIKLKVLLNKFPFLKKTLISILKLFPSLYNRLERIKPIPTFEKYTINKIYHDINNIAKGDK